jgi:hypothetical protein
LNRKEAEAGSYLNIGNSYAALGQFSRAFRYYYLSLELFKDLRLKNGIALVEENIRGLNNFLISKSKS